MNIAKIAVLLVIGAVAAGCSSSMDKIGSFGTPVVEAAAVTDFDDEVTEEVSESDLIAERGHQPQIIDHYIGDYDRNTIVIVPEERKLYLSNGDGTAVVFPVAVGKDGFAWIGEAVVGMKRVNPIWTPPASMIERKPELAQWANGMPGGPDNPLGVRAIYLFDKDGNDTLYRIHGTNAPETIGTEASSGCIRMYNQHVSWLYERIDPGNRVIVAPGAGDVAVLEMDGYEEGYIE